LRLQTCALLLRKRADDPLSARHQYVAPDASAHIDWAAEETRMETPAPSARQRAPLLAYRLTDTYGLVLALIAVDYLVVSTIYAGGWLRVAAVFFLGSTVVLTLRVSRAPRIWQILAVVYLVSSVLTAIVSEVAPGPDTVSQAISILAGVLLFVTPFVILRHIASHPVITTETVLGAVSVYLLIGFSFAFLYTGIAALSSMPFFAEDAPATLNNTLFFSYTTLTTVGYGNLVPAGSLGQTCAMLEALIGQIYLVLIVARLVALWGQPRPPAIGPTLKTRRDVTPLEAPEGGDPPKTTS
jgi:hypothetical protein